MGLSGSIFNCSIRSHPSVLVSVFSPVVVLMLSVKLQQHLRPEVVGLMYLLPRGLPPCLALQVILVLFPVKQVQSLTGQQVVHCKPLSIHGSLMFTQSGVGVSCSFIGPLLPTALGLSMVVGRLATGNCWSDIHGFNF